MLIRSVVGRDSSKRRPPRLVETHFRQGPFAPPELPGFDATTSPSDSRPSHGLVIYSHAALTSGLRAASRPNGPLRFLIALSGSAAPFPPGEPDRCICSLLRGQCQASPYPEGWPLSIGVTRPKTGSLALRLTPLPSEASERRITP